jgi:hypothetical protein
VMSDANTFSRSRHSVGTPNIRARDSILSIGTVPVIGEDDERVLNESGRRPCGDRRRSRHAPSTRSCISPQYARSRSAAAREGLAKVHEVVWGRVDSAHRLEGGRVGDRDQYDEASHRLGMESLGHALQRQAPLRTRRRDHRRSATPQVRASCGNDDHRRLDVRSVGIFVSGSLPRVTSPGRTSAVPTRSGQGAPCAWNAENARRPHARASVGKRRRVRISAEHFPSQPFAGDGSDGRPKFSVYVYVGATILPLRRWAWAFFL